MHRLLRCVTANKSLLTVLGFHEWDKADVETGLQIWLASNQPVVDLQFVGMKQGERVLTAWFSQHCPGVTKDRRSLYAKRMVAANVVTVERLVDITTATTAAEATGSTALAAATRNNDGSGIHWLESCLGDEHDTEHDTEEVYSAIKSMSSSFAISPQAVIVQKERATASWTTRLFGCFSVASAVS